MKYAVAALVLLGSTVSFASARLVCWNLYSKSGARPTFTAEIARTDALHGFVINQDPNGATFSTSGLKQGAVGARITTKHSPYYGNQRFDLAAGIQLILPLDLEGEALANATLPGGQLPPNLAPRQNGVLQVAGRRFSPDQGGDGFVRMHCISNFR